MNYTDIRKLRMREGISLPKLKKELSNKVSVGLLSSLERGEITKVLNLGKRESIERWIKNARRRYYHKRSKRTKQSKG